MREIDGHTKGDFTLEETYSAIQCSPTNHKDTQPVKYPNVIIKSRDCSG